MKKRLYSAYKKNKTLFITCCVCIFLLLCIFLIFGINSRELSSIATDAAILGIIALGQTFVMLVAGIDFSVQWLLCAAAICVSNIYIKSILALSEIPLFLILLIVLAGSTLIGCFNGIGVAYFGINPMIMTFGVNVLIHGALLAYTNGISGLFMPPEIKDFLNHSWGPLPILVYIWAGLTVAATLMLSGTTFGRRIYAVGRNPLAAYYSGIRVKRIKMFAYCISGFTAGLGGILMAASIGRSYLGMGDNTIVQSILAVTIGGTAISGGRGSYIGSVIGVITLTALMHIFSKLSVHAGIQHLALGVILMFTIVITSPYLKKPASPEGEQA